MKVKLLRNGITPKYMSAGAAGMDLCAALDAPVTIWPGERKLIGTGIAIALPHGYEGQVRPRSGLALKHGITVLNAPGTVDEDYRGEVKVLLINHSAYRYIVEHGERIAQLVITAVQRETIEEVDELDGTVRGAGGYGHTGTR